MSSEYQHEIPLGFPPLPPNTIYLGKGRLKAWEYLTSRKVEGLLRYTPTVKNTRDGLDWYGPSDGTSKYSYYCVVEGSDAHEHFMALIPERFPPSTPTTITVYEL